MSLQLSLHTQPEVPVQAEILCPERLTDLSIAEIEKTTILHGNQPTPIADFFRITGNNDGELHLKGNMEKIKHIGQGMHTGKIYIEGSAGAHLGANMIGGEISVDGNSGDWTGAEMQGGKIHIKGNSGSNLGAAYPGSPTGMAGGEIVVHNNAGKETGSAMRNGLIAVGGQCGDFAGMNMLAGTIIVAGLPGIRNGAAMQRGSLVFLQPVEMLPTFSYSCHYTPAYLRLYLQYLLQQGFPVDEKHISASYARWCGDMLESGKGEILVI